MVRYTRVDALLGDYLRNTITDSDESCFSVVAGVADRRTRGHPPVRLDLDPAVVDTAGAATTPISRRVSTSAGEAGYAVFPVQVAGDARPGALVVVEFFGPGRAEVTTVVQVLVGNGVARWHWPPVSAG